MDPVHAQAGQDLRSPQIRCYHCQGIFTTAVVRQPQLHHVRCPYCSTINGVPAQNAGPMATLNAAMNNAEELSPAAMQRQEQLLRRLQAREITPLVRSLPLLPLVRRLRPSPPRLLASPFPARERRSLSSPQKLPPSRSPPLALSGGEALPSSSFPSPPTLCHALVRLAPLRAGVA